MYRQEFLGPSYRISKPQWSTPHYLRVLRKKFRITLNTSLVRNPDLM